MKTGNRQKKAELEKKLVIPTPGVAQANGYANRSVYRNSIYAGKRKIRNTKFDQTPEYLQMGGARMNGLPCPPECRRKKFKGWQRNLQNAR